MEPIKVTLESITGTKQEAMLYHQSGLLKMGNEWSSVAHEKAFNKTITEIKEPNVIVEVEKYVANVTISESHSGKGKKPKAK